MIKGQCNETDAVEPASLAHYWEK